MKAYSDFFRKLEELLASLTSDVRRDMEDFSKAGPGDTVERLDEESTTTHPSGAVTRTVKTTIVVKRVRLR